MTVLTRRILALRLPAVTALALVALGCGDSKGYRVSGKVSFKGQPIPVGKIYFNPDGSKGNSGPAGYADIKDGAYDTAASGGRGIVGGPTVIVVEGFDPNASGDKDKGDKSGEVTIKALFPRYEVVVDLPKESQTKDVDVPGDAATRNPNKKESNVIVP